jgi:hypothetical protein
MAISRDTSIDLPSTRSMIRLSVSMRDAWAKARACEAGDPNLSSTAESYLTRLSKAVLGMSGRM